MNVPLRVNAGLSADQARELARTRFGIDGDAQESDGWEGQNFRLECADGSSVVLKIASSDVTSGSLAAQNAMLHWIAEHDDTLHCPRPVPNVDGCLLDTVVVNGHSHAVRVLTYIDGVLIADLTERSHALWDDVGRTMARLDRVLEGFSHPELRRTHLWDLSEALVVVPRYADAIADSGRRQLLYRYLSRVSVPFGDGLPGLRGATIHNDANDHNLLVAEHDPHTIVGVIDFGDALKSRMLFEVAIAAAYAMLGAEDIMAPAVAVASGYHGVCPLTEGELDLLYPSIVLRLCTSVVLSAYRTSREPDRSYLAVSEAAAWDALRRLESISPSGASHAFREACQVKAAPTTDRSSAERITRSRRAHVGRGLSLSYSRPLHLVRGSMQYLYDGDGREYLDTVNNVCHVGHCHPRIVQAAHRQMATLNTNSRYLYAAIAEYAERLAATFPDPLSVCYFVCSGSEANELALRLARTHTGRQDVIVLDGAYHGNSASLIELSPYKHGGPGGQGPPPHVHVAELPDVFRGAQRSAVTAGSRYASDVRERIAEIEGDGGNLAAFFCESLPSCAGQIVLPFGYLEECYSAVHAAGGVCVADEVQVGFGRVGSHYWGFESQGVIPDIVTLGKPIGNGHPLGAVVTTPEIAASFDNGMEYFNTFGGNPVSCAVGLAVLDVIEQEGLQQNALTVGRHLKAGLRTLAERYGSVGDVRGEGLFLGIEFVDDPAQRTPFPALVTRLVEGLKSARVLASADGPDHNVIKIKPPMCFTAENAERYVLTLDRLLNQFTS